MDKSRKISVGDRLYVVKPHYTTGKYCNVSKVGKKYFYLSELPQEKFSIDNMRSVCNNWSWSYRCFESKEAYDLKIEVTKRRQVVNSSIHLLSDEEINIVYDMIINKKKQ